MSSECSTATTAENVGKVTRAEAMLWLAAYGDEVKDWQEGDRCIRGYISQLEEEIMRLNGQQKLEGLDA